MGKLILFKLESGDFLNGFDVTLQICEDNPDGITHPFTTIKGKLPPCQSITQHYQQWQESYRSLHQDTRLGSSLNQVTHISHNCQISASQLRDTLSHWYHCEVESFAKVRERLLTVLNTQEVIRLLVQTNLNSLQFFPWHLFFESFLNQYPFAELAIAPVEYNTLNINFKKSESLRILAIFGNSTGININPDRQVINNLEKAEIITLNNPTRKELFAYLYEQEWDLLFFAGHSGKNQQTGQGQLYLNEEDIISIEDFNNAIKQAIQKGLKLAIFNSCDGLGLAQDLVALHLPQVIVMGEMIPDAVAHVFITEFLRGFANNQPLYLAVRQAREKLQPLENQFPCATWLPIICQNPASLPLTWHNLQGFDFQADISPRQFFKTPENFTHLVFETSIVNTQLTLEYNSLFNCYCEVLINYTDIDLSMGEEISQLLLSKGGKIILKELQKRKVKQLGQILTTTAGKLKAETIFHTIIYDYQRPELTDLSLLKTVINRCLTLADSSGFSSLAFPVFFPNHSQLSISQIAIIFADEIYNYLQGSTNLQEIKVILQNTSNLSKNVVNEGYNRFYHQFRQYLDLCADLEHRQGLIAQLKPIFRQRKMNLGESILSSYEESLTKFKEDWINSNLHHHNQELDYHRSLAKISQEISHPQEDNNEQIMVSLHQNYHQKAGDIWQRLAGLDDEEEILFLLDELNRDIDGFAWLNDQYELAISSRVAKQKKVNEILQNEIEELKKGQQLLQDKLLNLYQQKMLQKKEEGKERNLIFREYPKINVKVKPEDLPSEYRSEKITYNPDKKALKSAYDRGIDISEYAEVDRNLKPKFGFKN